MLWYDTLQVIAIFLSIAVAYSIVVWACSKNWN